MPQKDDRPIGRSNAVVAGQRCSIPWIWEGVVAEGAVTLLSAPEKVGKTTLLSLLLDRRRAGGELLGRKVCTGNTVLCSEENDAIWALRQPVRGATTPGESAGDRPRERRPLRRATRGEPERRGGRRPGHGHCDLEYGAAEPLLFGSAAAIRRDAPAPAGSVGSTNCRAAPTG